MPAQSIVTRHLIVSAVFVTVAILLNWPEVILISQIGFTAWYPETGLLLALMLGISPGYAPLTAVAGVLAGMIVYHTPLVSYSQTVCVLGITASYGGAAYLLRGPLRIDRELRRRRDVLTYVFIAMLAAAISAVIGAACLAADHAIPWSQFLRSALAWFSGDSIALLSVAPFLLIHVVPFVQSWLNGENNSSWLHTKIPALPLLAQLGIAIEAICQVLGIGLVICIIFSSQWGRFEPFYLAFVPIVWIAMRRGIRGVVAGILALNFGVVLAVRFFTVPTNVLAGLGLFMLVVSAVGLITGSAITERLRVGIELTQQTAYMNSLMENSPFGIAVLDRMGGVEFANAAFEKLSLYRQEASSGRLLNQLFVPDEREPDAIRVLAPVFSGGKLHRPVRWRRRDGKTLDLDLHAIPMTEGGYVRGAYTIYQDISEQIKAAEAEKHHTLALNRLVKELEQRTHQMTGLSEMGDLLECTESEGEVGAIIARSIRTVFPEAVCGVLYTFRSSRNLLGAVVSWGMKRAPDENLTRVTVGVCGAGIPIGAKLRFAAIILK